MVRPRFIQGLVCAVVGVALIALAPLTAVAGDNSTTLPNGANLAVSIDDPLTCTEFIVPSGDLSIDVDVLGSASIGIGDPDATFVYVIDVSGSTSTGSGTGCSPVLQCEKNFFINLNDAVISDGSTDEVGIVEFESSASIALGLTNPTDPAVNSTINGLTSGGLTNCADALVKARTLVLNSSNGTNSVVFASDGHCTSPSIGAARNALAATGAIVNSIAVGTSSSCTTDHGYGSLAQIAANGGTCYHVPDPGNLPDLIDNLIGSTLESLEIEVDGGGKTLISNADIVPDLPVAGAASVVYDTAVTSLDPNDHTICVTASGSDVTGGVADVTQCETIHLLQLDFGTGVPPSATNNLNFDFEHTVTVQIAGGTGPDRDVDFVVTGQNAGPAESVSVAAPGSGEFNYSVPQDCASLGTDTITASTMIAGVADSIEFTKDWFDDVPPDVSCDETVNPHGNQNPQAPGQGGRGQNQDGFYQLNAEDPNIANCTVTLMVVDGDGYVFPGPFLPGDNIKYTQDDDVPQVQKKMGGNNGQAGAIRWHLIGHGDLTVIATDPSGNASSAMCLVPPPPM